MKFLCIWFKRLYFFGGILNDILYLYYYKEKLRFSSKHAHHIKVNTHSLKPIRRGGLFAASTVSSAEMQKKIIIYYSFFLAKTMFCAGKEKWVSSKMSLHYLYTNLTKWSNTINLLLIFILLYFWKANNFKSNNYIYTMSFVNNCQVCGTRTEQIKIIASILIVPQTNH